MGRHKKKDIENAIKIGQECKDDLEKIKEEFSGDDLIAAVFGPTTSSSNSVVANMEDEHVPINTLQQIKNKLGEKVVKKDPETGEDILVPLIEEDKKIQAVMALLADRGINIVDYLENLLREGGYSTDLLISINSTFDRAVGCMRDIANINIQKRKLDIEKQKVEVQLYKAKLKEREVELKEKSASSGISSSGNTNIIAVGSQAELMAMLQGKRNEIDADIMGEE